MDLSQPSTRSLQKLELELVYVDDRTLPGIQRHRKGKGFAYRGPDGHWLQPRDARDKAHLERIRKLAIPPAYVDVWICPLAHGHLQATGRDARGRKQYRYHASWRQARDEGKFARMQSFGQALPQLRQRVTQDLARIPTRGAPGRDHVLATLVRLLDTTHVRVGNTAYARDNQSFGLTTLRNRHAQVEGNVVRLRFRGKSGVWQNVALQDPRVARIVRRCQTLPGQDLFQYEDEDGSLHGLGSAEVNDYIREASGGDFTAKDFRTWHATVHAWALLAPSTGTSPADEPDSTTARNRRIGEVLKEVAGRLGNTVAVCRKSYVHPTVLECALCGAWPEACADDIEAKTEPTNAQGLNNEERGLLRFLSALQAAKSS